MTRKILLLNLALVIVIAALGWVIRTKWLEGEARTRAIMAQKIQPPTVMPPPAPAPVPVVAPADYLEVATRTLYSSDRNPNVVVPPPPPPPPPPKEPVMPPLPVYYGQMGFGGDPVVVLTSPTHPEQKSYSVGEKIGEFTLVAFNRDTVTFDWNGKEVQRKVEDLAPKPVQQGQQPQAGLGGSMPVAALTPAPAASNGGSVNSISGNSSSSAVKDPLSGPDMGAGLKGCVMGDNSPGGTVQDGWKKVVGGGLLGMGTSCHWEQQK